MPRRRSIRAVDPDPPLDADTSLSASAEGAAQELVGSLAGKAREVAASLGSALSLPASGEAADSAAEQTQGQQQPEQAQSQETKSNAGTPSKGKGKGKARGRKRKHQSEGGEDAQEQAGEGDAAPPSSGEHSTAHTADSAFVAADVAAAKARALITKSEETLKESIASVLPTAQDPALLQQAATASLAPASTSQAAAASVLSFDAAGALKHSTSRLSLPGWMRRQSKANGSASASTSNSNGRADATPTPGSTSSAASAERSLPVAPVQEPALGSSSTRSSLSAKGKNWLSSLSSPWKRVKLGASRSSAQNEPAQASRDASASVAPIYPDLSTLEAEQQARRGELNIEENGQPDTAPIYPPLPQLDASLSSSQNGRSSSAATSPRRRGHRKGKASVDSAMSAGAASNSDAAMQDPAEQAVVEINAASTNPSPTLPSPSAHKGKTPHKSPKPPNDPSVLAHHDKPGKTLRTRAARIAAEKAVHGSPQAQVLGASGLEDASAQDGAEPAEASAAETQGSSADPDRDERMAEPEPEHPAALSADESMRMIRLLDRGAAAPEGAPEPATNGHAGAADGSEGVFDANANANADAAEAAEEAASAPLAAEAPSSSSVAETVALPEPTKEARALLHDDAKSDSASGREEALSREESSRLIALLDGPAAVALREGASSDHEHGPGAPDELEEDEVDEDEHILISGPGVHLSPPLRPIADPAAELSAPAAENGALEYEDLGEPVSRLEPEEGVYDHSFEAEEDKENRALDSSQEDSQEPRPHSDDRPVLIDLTGDADEEDDVDEGHDTFAGEGSEEEEDDEVIILQPAKPRPSSGTLRGPLAQSRAADAQRLESYMQRLGLAPADIADTSAADAIAVIGAQALYGRGPTKHLYKATSRLRPVARAHYRKRDPIGLSEHKREVQAIRKKQQSRDRIITALKSLRPGQKWQAQAYAELVDGLSLQARVSRIINDRGAGADAAKSKEFYERKVVERFLLRERDARSSIGPSQAKRTEYERLKKERQARERALRGVLGRKPLPAQLTDEQDAVVKEAFSKRGIVSSIPGAQVNDEDIAKLRPRQWLNDESINFHGKLVQNRADEAAKQRAKAHAAGQKPDVRYRVCWDIHFFNSFFYTRLDKDGFPGVKRWTKKIDLFSKDIVLFPVNLGNAHWVTGAINFRLKRIEYYDSMHTPNSSFFRTMRSYLEQESLDKRKQPMDWTGWRDYSPKHFPYQSNGYDCGVFTIATIEQLSRRDPLVPMLAPLSESSGNVARGDGFADEDEDDYAWNFAERNMSYLRKRVVYELVTKQLLD